MKQFIFQCVACIILTACPVVSFSGTVNTLIDDLSDKNKNNLGFQRQFLNDTISGGSSSTEYYYADGILHLSGKIVPPRGQPGWSSLILPLDKRVIAQSGDVFNGIRIVIKIAHGNVSISANSSEIDNFDYHTAPLHIPADGQFHEIKIAFGDMKRSWSAQTPLDITSLNSLSITAYSFQKSGYEFQVDEVSFYKD